MIDLDRVSRIAALILAAIFLLIGLAFAKENERLREQRDKIMIILYQQQELLDTCVSAVRERTTILESFLGEKISSLGD